MSNNFRVKPSKPVSIVAMIVGVLFVVIGITVIMPQFGLFGVIWTLGAAGIAIYHAVNVFTERGIAAYDIDVEAPDGRDDGETDFETRLRRLHRLREDGLISEDEFRRKRAEIMQDDW